MDDPYGVEVLVASVSFSICSGKAMAMAFIGEHVDHYIIS